MLAAAYLIKYSREVEKTLPSQGRGMPVSAAGRGGPLSVAAGRGMSGLGVAAGRGMSGLGVAAGRGMYAQGVAAGRGMYAQGVAAVSAATGGVAAGAAGGNLATLQHGVDGSSGSKRRRASKAATDARVRSKPRWAKKRNAEQGVIVISDDEDGK